ncbi:MAG TPA: PASTA domain-containing protein [Clostridiales bacterium]|jgi:eukaryotic-like serine/threonine-protein kinase|nr:PASTA domain-containing protein [Clostridiales bacterium]HQP70541.1 PASTA domain-containing protein [Clostridiales bacterium]
MKPFATALITSFLVSIITGILIFTGVIDLKKILPEDFLSADGPETSAVVPNFVNLKITEAQKAASEFGLKIITEEKYVEKTDPEIVLEQFPLPGFKAKTGDSVKLIISKAEEVTFETISEEELKEIELSEKVIMPELTGLDLATAKDLLNKSGITSISENYEENNNIEKNKIISYNPPAGSEINADTVVDIVISRGVIIKQVIVPNLYNKSLEKAKADLEKSKLKLGTVTKVTDEDKAFNIIIGQSVQWGARVKEGTVIDLKLNAEAEEKLGW